MKRYHNKVYTLKNGKPFKAPLEVVNALKNQGMTISSGCSGKSLEVYTRIDGKTTYMGTLASFVKGAGSYKYRDGDTFNVTLRNLKKVK